MPEGRFLSRSVSESGQLANVSLEAALLFTWCVPHLDCEGRMSGEPSVVRGKVVPRRAEFTEDLVAECLLELALAKLLLWYEKDGTRWLAFPKFHAHQKGMRKDREAASRVPPPDGVGVVQIAALPTNSGPAPDLVGVSEVKESEVKSSSVLRTGATPRQNVSHLMGVLRHTGYAPDGKPPADYRDSRDADVFRRLLARGYSPDDVADALWGVRAVADLELPLPEGGKPWLGPREKFTARWLVNQQWAGRDLLGLARDVWRKGQVRRDRGGPAEDVADIVGRIA